MNVVDPYAGSSMKVTDLYALIRKAWYSKETDLPSLVVCLSLHNDLGLALEAAESLVLGYKNIYHATVTESKENEYKVEYTTTLGDPITFVLNVVRCDAQIDNMKTI